MSQVQEDAQVELDAKRAFANKVYANIKKDELYFDTIRITFVCNVGTEFDISNIRYSIGNLVLTKKTDLDEIKEIFETTVVKWFGDSTKKCNRSALFDTVWNGDSENLTKEMNALLRRTISYHDYKEDFYHAFLAGIFTGAGYMVDSNKEHGEGRSDVVVYDSINGRVASDYIV